MTYDDGTKAALGAELQRLETLYRDNYSLYVGGFELCRDEMGTYYALYASATAEVAMIEQLDPAALAALRWAPTNGVKYANCGSAAGSVAERTRALKDSLAAAADFLGKANTWIAERKWDRLAAAADAFTPTAIAIATGSARDVALNQDWKAARSVAADLILMCGRLRDPGTAAAAAKDLVALRQLVEPLIAVLA